MLEFILDPAHVKEKGASTLHVNMPDDMSFSYKCWLVQQQTLTPTHTQGTHQSIPCISFQAVEKVWGQSGLMHSHLAHCLFPVGQNRSLFILADPTLNMPG